MSGGALFEYTYPNFESADGKWEDEELNELYHDIFCGGEFSVRGYGGLCQSLDFYLSGDTSEDDYHEAVAKFKSKWMNRTPENRLQFYQDKLQEYADRLKKEIAISEKTCHNFEEQEKTIGEGYDDFHCSSDGFMPVVRWEGEDDNWRI